MAFLISTPESGVDSISITYALLDPIMTVARPLVAFVTASHPGNHFKVAKTTIYIRLVTPAQFMAIFHIVFLVSYFKHGDRLWRAWKV